MEIDADELIPIREIRLDSNSLVILIMSRRVYYGYWIDNTATLDYFKKHFKSDVISQEALDKNRKSYAVGQEYSRVISRGFGV